MNLEESQSNRGTLNIKKILVIVCMTNKICKHLIQSLLLSKRRLVSVLFDNYQGDMKLRSSPSAIPLVPSTKILQAMEARNDIIDSLIINSHATESDRRTLGDHEVRQCEDTNFGFKI